MSIAYYIASPTWGGGEQYVFDLAKAMKEHYRITPIFLFPAHSDPAMVQRFSAIGECPTFPYADKFHRFSLLAACRLSKLLKQYQVDILHINSRQSYFQAVWAKRRIPGLRVIAAQHLVRQAQNSPLWRWMYRRIDTLICVSDCVREEYLHPFSMPVFKDVRVIHNSTPIAQAPIQIHYDVPVPSIFYHGRIAEEKGIFRLIARLEKISGLPFRLVIAGSVDRHDEDRWRTLMQTSPIRDRIDYLGFRTDIETLIPHYQIGVIPSLARESGGPLALLENMAMGLPSIASDNGAEVEFIQSEHNGILCSPTDDEQWCQALRRLLTVPTIAQKLGQQAQQDFYDLHTYDRFLTAMHKLYEYD